MKAAVVVHKKNSLKKEGCLHNYLFGCSFYKGILADYTAKNYEVELFDEKIFKSGLDKLSADYDHFNFQLALDIPAAAIEKLLSLNRTITGWCPAYAASKEFQVSVLAKNKITSEILPRQIIIANKSQLKNIDKNKFIRWFQREYLIVKSFYSSRSTMYGGSDYLIFHKWNWDKFVKFILKQKGWFSLLNGIIVCELIETAGSSWENNGVLHKAHISTGLTGSLYSSWPLKCAMMIGKFHTDRIGDSIKTMADIFELVSWESGSLEPYREIMCSLMELFFPLPCLFSLDLIIQPDGKIYFLEMNRAAGSFLDPSGKDSRTALEEYMHCVLSLDFAPKEMLKNYIEYKNFNDLIEYSADGVWIAVENLRQLPF